MCFFILYHKKSRNARRFFSKLLTYHAKRDILITSSHALREIGGENMSSKIIFSNLRAEMARENITIQDIAKVLNRSRETVSSKLNGKSILNLDEAFKINDTFFPKSDLRTLFAELLDTNSKSA